MAQQLQRDSTADSRRPHWEDRFRAWRVALFQLAARPSTRALVTANRSGVYQLHAWDRTTGDLLQLTHRPDGKLFGTISPDGEWVYYLDDEGGNELGRLVRVPWSGGDPELVGPELEPYALAGTSVSLDGSTVGFTTATRDGFRLLVRRGTGEWRELYHATHLTGGPVLSTDGRIAVMTTSAGTLDRHLVSIDVETGAVLAELREDGASITPGPFSPAAGDSLMLVGSDQSGFNRPALWDARSGQRKEIAIQGEGDVHVADWSLDGSQILFLHMKDARTNLLRCPSATLEAVPIAVPPGTIGGAQFDEDGAILAMLEDGLEASRIVILDPETDTGRTVLRGGDAPDGYRWRAVRFPSTGGVEIQAWLATPPGNGPFPLILDVHGGPSAVQTEMYGPVTAAWVDHGFAWLSVNYRGSTTFGRQFEAAIRGRPGFLEIDDMEAAREWAIAEGIAIPGQVIVTGGSYGGYLTLMALATRPASYAAGIGLVAIADWTLMYRDQAETLRRYQRAIFEGSPDEKPGQHADSSPLTYASEIEAPLLVIQGSNDTRCPPAQMRAFEDRMLELGKPIRLHWFDAGHGSRAIEQNIEHMRLRLAFAHEALGLPPTPRS